MLAKGYGYKEIRRLKSKSVVLYLFPVAAVKMTTTGWLKITEIYPFTVLRARILRSVSQG